MLGDSSIVRPGRPRVLGERNAKGKLRPSRRSSEDNEGVRGQRKRAFGVTDRQSKHSLASFLAGVLYLRDQITYDELARFISFLRLAPDLGPHAILYGERVQGVSASDVFPRMRNDVYHALVKKLGRESMDILHALANDRLICPISTLRDVLAKVPLTSITFVV